MLAITEDVIGQVMAVANRVELNILGIVNGDYGTI